MLIFVLAYWSRNFSFVFWENWRKTKSPFEINWPLRSYCPNIYTVKEMDITEHFFRCQTMLNARSMLDSPILMSLLSIIVPKMYARKSIGNSSDFCFNIIKECCSVPLWCWIIHDRKSKVVCFFRSEFLKNYSGIFQKELLRKYQLCFSGNQITVNFFKIFYRLSDWKSRWLHIYDADIYQTIPNLAVMYLQPGCFHHFCERITFKLPIGFSN